MIKLVRKYFVWGLGLVAVVALLSSAAMAQLFPPPTGGNSPSGPTRPPLITPIRPPLVSPIEP